MNPSRPVLAILVSGLILTGCEPGPEPIAYGEDTCARCVMAIADERFGAEIVTDKGKVHRFDSIECLASFAAGLNPASVHSIWVTDFSQPGQLVAVEDAVFLTGSAISSPMGMSLLAFESEAGSRAVRDAFGGELIAWSAVVERVSRAAGGHADHAHAAIGVDTDAIE